MCPCPRLEVQPPANQQGVQPVQAVWYRRVVTPLCARYRNTRILLSPVRLEAGAFALLSLPLPCRLPAWVALCLFTEAHKENKQKRQNKESTLAEFIQNPSKWPVPHRALGRCGSFLALWNITAMKWWEDCYNFLVLVDFPFLIHSGAVTALSLSGSRGR